MKKTLILTFFSIFTYTQAGQDSNLKYTKCLVSKEFITIHRFLKQKQFALPEKKIRSIAMNTAKGCTGSAINFIRVFNLLTKVGIPSHKAVSVSTQFINLKPYSSKAFVEVFKKTYLAAYLDQNIDFALSFALALSTETQSEYKNIMYDFNKLLGFCLGRNHLNLPRKKCAQIVKNVSLSGNKINQKVSNAFIGVFKFLTQSSKGPKISPYKAVKIATKLSSYGEDVETNLIHGYRYAHSEKGLKLSRDKALAIAIKLSENSLQKNL